MFNKIRWVGQNDDVASVDLTVITVTWNSAKQLPALVDSLRESEGSVTAEWFLVDNASTDGSAGLAGELCPWATIVVNDQNMGFAKANNQAWERARGRHILLLNPDMQVAKDALQKTVDRLDADKTIAVMGAKLLMTNNQPVPQLRRFPSIVDQLAVLLKIAKLIPISVSHYYGKDLDLETAQDVDSVRGSYFAISKSAKQLLGMLDERYFLWFEEVDYCRAAKAAGLRVRYEPDVIAYDSLTSPSFAQRESTWKNKVFSASMIAYFDKWHPGWQVALIKTAAQVSFWLTRLSARVTKK